jgi:hypothetical protein
MAATSYSGGSRSQVLLLLLAAFTLSVVPTPSSGEDPFCENVLPPGYGLGGAVVVATDCRWRPQVHFISTLTGRRVSGAGPLRVPVITNVPGPLPTSTSGAPD